jgi:hypothetical protein
VLRKGQKRGQASPCTVIFFISGGALTLKRHALTGNHRHLPHLQSFSVFQFL